MKLSTRMDEIEARLKAATPGPWGPGKPSDSVVSTNPNARPLERLTPQDELVAYYGGEPIAESMARADRELVAHAPEDLAWALAQLRQLLAGLALVDDRIHEGDFAAARVKLRAIVKAAMFEATP